MPNPYHDEAGRFCSAGEMQAAVKRLASDGKFQEAFILSQELAAIGQHNLQEAEEQLAAFRVGDSKPQVQKAQPKKTAARSSKSQPSGPRGYTTGSRQASAAAQAAREGKVAPALPAAKQSPTSPPVAAIVSPEKETRVPDAPQATVKVSRAQLTERLQSLSRNDALQLVRESGSARLALAYADLHGWPEQSEGFDSLVLDDAAMIPSRQHLVAHRVQTQSAMNRIVNNRAATSEALTMLAANPKLSPHVAVRLITRAEAHPQAYAQIRSALLNESGAAA